MLITAPVPAPAPQNNFGSTGSATLLEWIGKDEKGDNNCNREGKAKEIKKCEDKRGKEEERMRSKGTRYRPGIQLFFVNFYTDPGGKTIKSGTFCRTSKKGF